MEQFFFEVDVALKFAKEFSSDVHYQMRLEMDLVLSKHGFALSAGEKNSSFKKNFTLRVVPISKKKLWQNCVTHFVTALKSLLRQGRVVMFYDCLDDTLLGESVEEFQFEASREYINCICFAGFLLGEIDLALFVSLFPTKTMKDVNDVFASWITK